MLSLSMTCNTNIRWEGGNFTRGKLHGRCYSTAAIGADFGKRLGNRLGFMLGFGIRLFGK